MTCSARSRSRVPLPSMVEACRDGDNLSVASGAYGYVWRWECREGLPAIVGGVPADYDTGGYAFDEWKNLE